VGPIFPKEGKRVQDMVLALMLLVCLLTDLSRQKIYNLVIFPVMVFGLFYNLATGGWPGLLQSLLGILAGLGILIIPFALGGMGAGDVKLLSVIGAVKGPLFIFYTALGMGLAGGIIALAILIYRKNLLNTLSRFLRGVWLLLLTRFRVVAFEFDHEKIMFPYGLAITVGAMGAFWWIG
jgi:prepilin peptidase CpaA